MEPLEHEEIKCFDDTAAFIYSSVSSTLPSGLPKEPCEVDNKAWFVKTEATTPVRNTTIYNCVMEASEHEEIKCFDDTAAFIYSSVSSTLPSGLPKEPCEVDNKAWFVKTEAATPERNTTEVDQDPARLQLECELGLKKFIKTEVTLPQQVEEHEAESALDLPIDPCEVDSKTWFIKTEPASPFKDATDVDQNPGLQMECDTSLKILIKTEVTSPQYVGEHEEESATSPTNNQATGSDWSLQNSFYPHTAQLQSNLQNHVHSVHEKLNVNPCPYCDYNPNLKGTLKRHIDSVHKKIKAFQCPHCEHITNWKGNLKKHIDLVHNKIRAFQCAHCKYTTCQKGHLKKHIDSVHKKIRAFQCPYCELKTNWKSNLKKHIGKVHTKIRAFDCAHCEYKTNQKSTLKRHIDSVHKNIWAFQCPFCEHKTNWRSILKKHIDSVHNNVWAFQCAHCKYKSSQKGHLNRHIDSIHKKIKAFQCPRCEYKTNWKSSLKKHIDSVHKNIRAFQCPYCDFKTNWNSNLNKHIHKVHKK